MRTDMKLIAVDLDGTLLNSRNEVSAENLSAISSLADIGVSTAVLTGRTMGEIPPELLAVDCAIEYYVYSNGAGINDKNGVLSYHPIEKEMAKTVFDILLEYQTLVEVYSNGKPYLDRTKFSYEVLDEYKIHRGFIPVIEATRVKVDSLYDLVHSDDHDIEMYDVFFKNMDERTECWRRIEELGLGVTSSMENNLEIIADGISKGVGITDLCDIVGISLDDAVVIGDSLNDMTAFTTATHKYAVSNACDEIKSVATKVICSNDEHIMVYMLNELTIKN